RHLVPLCSSCIILLSTRRDSEWSLSFLSAVSEWRADCTVLLRRCSTDRTTSMRLSADFAWIEGGKHYDFTTYSAGNDAIDVELDQLTDSAYLLTLDPALALSVVMAAIDTSIDTSMENPASRRDLLRRTIEISLARLRLDASAASDRESLAVEALLYSDSGF